MENRLYGSSACGEGWTAQTLTSDSDELIEILVHNPHTYGNETAIDEMLSSMAIWGDISFEKDILNDGEPQRNMGMLLMLVSIVFLGIALFSSLIHVKNSKTIWLLGLLVLFAGLYFTYSASGVSFWSESIVSNTTILGFSMMFYMLFLSMTIARLLRTTKSIGAVTVLVLALAIAVLLVLPIVTDIFLYDTLIYWIIIQLVTNLVLAVCLTKEIVAMNLN